mgnify:CR=1 FL=1
MNCCPNCGNVPALCHCTWEEMGEALTIKRRSDAAERRRRRRPTVVEADRMRRIFGGPDCDSDHK